MVGTRRGAGAAAGAPTCRAASGAPASIADIPAAAQLFDYSADRVEQRDLAANRTRQAEMQRLNALLDSLLENSPQSRGAR